MFDHRAAACSVAMSFEGEIIKTELYVSHVQDVEILRVAVILRTPNGVYQLRSYEVSPSGGCFPVHMIELRRAARPVALKFVSSHYESSLVVLSEGSENEPRVDFSRSARETGTKLIEVSVRGAVELETFSLNGYSFLGVASVRGVEILRLNEFLHHVMTFDSISVKDVTDLKVFRMGFDHFIVISTAGRSQYLYEFKDGSFQLKQTFDAYRVTQVLTIEVPTCRDDVLLAFVRDDGKAPLLVYTWDGSGHRFELSISDVRRYVERNFVPLRNSQATFPNFGHSSAFLIELDTIGRTHVTSVNTALAAVSDPVFVNSVQVTHLMKNLRERFMFQEQFISRILQTLKFAVRPLLFRLPLFSPKNRFRDIRATHDVILDHVRGLRRAVFEKSPITLNDLKHKISTLNVRFVELGKMYQLIESQLKDVAIRNQPARFVSKTTFTGTVEGIELMSNMTTINAVNRYQVDPVVKSTLFASANFLPVKGLKRFKSSYLAIHGNLGSRINGINLVTQAVLVNRPQSIYSKLSLPALFCSSSSHIAHVNGIDLKKELVFTRHGIYGLQSDVHFLSQWTHFNSLSAGGIDGISLVELSRSTLTTVGEQSMTGSHLFYGRVLTGHITHNNRLNGFNIPTLAKSLARIDQVQYISGIKALAAGYTLIRNDIQFDGKLQGLKLPNDLFLVSVSQVIPVQKRFLGVHRFESPVTVGGRVDGLRLPADIVTLTKDNEECPTIRIPTGVDIFSDMAVKGRVDFVNIGDLSRRALLANEGRIARPTFNGPVHIRGNMDASGFINGVKVTRIALDAVYKSIQQSVVVTGHKTMRNVLIAPLLVVKSINHVQLGQVAKTRGNEFVSSKVIFDKLALNITHIKNALINDINLVELNLNRISLSNPGFIVSGKNFQGELRVTRSLEINGGTIDGLVPEVDLILKSKNGQQMFGPKIMQQNVTFDGTLIVNGRLTSRQRVNGLNITAINYRRIPLSSEQRIRWPMSLINSKAKRVTTTSINREDIGRFVSSIMFKAGNQIITSAQHFSNNLQFFGELSSTKGINGVYLGHIDGLAIKTKSKLNIFKTPVEFASQILTVDRDVTIYGPLNNVDLRSLSADSVHRRGESVINGRTEFMSGINVNGDLQAVLVNGAHLPTNVLTRSGNQTIQGNVIFTRRVRVGRNLDVVGTVNGLKLSMFDKNVIKTNRPNLVRGSMNFVHSLHAAGDIRTLNGRINGVRLSVLAANAMYKDYDQRIRDTKTFAAQVLFMTDLLTDLLGRRMIQPMVDDMVMINRVNSITFKQPQNFSHPVRISRSLHNVGQSITMLGQYGVNRLNLEHMARSACPLHASRRPVVVRGHKLFTNEAEIHSRTGLHIRGVLNGVDIRKNVLLLRSTRPQRLRGTRTLTTAFFTQNVDVGGRVNGYHLPTLALNTLRTYGKQKIVGRKAFKGYLVLEKGGEIMNLNGIGDLRTQLIGLLGQQVFFGDISVAQPLRVNGDVIVRGLVGGINMTHFVLNSLYKDTFQVITGPVNFEHVVFERSVDIAGPLNGVDLSGFAGQVAHFRNTLQTSDQLMKSVMTRQLRATDHLFKTLKTSTFEIDHFNLHQELDGMYGGYFELQGDGLVSLSELDASRENSTSYQLRYNRMTAAFELRRIEHNVAFVERFFFKLSGIEFAVVKASFNSTSSKTLLKAGDRVIGNLGEFVDNTKVLVYSARLAVICSLSAVQGQVKIHLLKQVPGQAASLKVISNLNVGASATKVTAFAVGSDIFVAIARSFKNVCSVTDSGSLVFKFDGTSKFELVQRIQVADSNSVAHYVLNDQQYLVFADSADADETLEAQAIHVYRWKPSVSRQCTFKLFQKVPFDNIADLVAFSFGPESRRDLFLAAVNRTAVQVWRHDGAAGFTDSWSMRAIGGQKLRPLFTDGHLYLMVGVDRTLSCIGSLVFEARTRGASLLKLGLESSWQPKR